LGTALLALATSHAIAQNQPASLPSPFTQQSLVAAQNQPGMTLGAAPLANVVAWHSTLPASIANAPDWLE